MRTIASAGCWIDGSGEPQRVDQDGQLQSSPDYAEASRNGRNGSFDPVSVPTQREPIMNAIDAYHAFDAREPGWLKVKLEP